MNVIVQRILIPLLRNPTIPPFDFYTKVDNALSTTTCIRLLAFSSKSLMILLYKILSDSDIFFFCHVFGLIQDEKQSIRLLLTDLIIRQTDHKENTCPVVGRYCSATYKQKISFSRHLFLKGIRHGLWFFRHYITLVLHCRCCHCYVSSNFLLPISRNEQ